MIRIALIALAALATIAAASPAAAQAGAPVRTLTTTTAQGSPVWIAERKADPCADRNCSSKPRRYVGAAPLGW